MDVDWLYVSYYFLYFYFFECLKVIGWIGEMEVIFGMDKEGVVKIIGWDEL